MNPRDRPTVLAVGSFPPPVHGAALVTERVAARLEAEAVVRRLDVEPGPGRLHPVRKAGRYLTVLAALVRARRGRPSLYLAASGGEAILADGVVLAVARLLGCPAVVHHHSTRYLRRRSRAMAGLCRLAGPGATHVVLCADMVGPLRRHYRSVGEVLVVDNAVIVDLTEGAPRRPPSASLRLGHLSNLSLEKGLDDVVDLALRLADGGTEVTLELAGPATDDEARLALDRAARALGPALRVPGLLDEAAKAAFFDRIDVFVFPSRYRHEAQPLVVYEALARGVPVVATDVGCLPDQLAGGGGEVIPAGQAFAPAAVALLPGLATAEAAAAARRRFEQARADSEAQLGGLTTLLVARPRSRGRPQP